MNTPDAFDLAEAEESRRHHRELNVSPKERAIQLAITKKKLVVVTRPAVQILSEENDQQLDDDESEQDDTREVSFEFYYCAPLKM